MVYREDLLVQTMVLAVLQVQKPFAFEDELKEKTDRLNALNSEQAAELTEEECAALIKAVLA